MSFTQKEKDCDHTIIGKYLIPAISDFAVFLYGSPGGNVWEDEFTPEMQRKARKTLLFYGISGYGILGAWNDEDDVNHGFALGPWVTYPGSPDLTPYELEKWNPYVFLSYRLTSIEEIPEFLDSLDKTDAIGIILPLPEKFQNPTQEILLKTLADSLRQRHKKIFGYSLDNVETKVQNEIKPDVIMGLIPDTVIESIRILPLFFDTLKIPDHLVPLTYRFSLEPPYAIQKIWLKNSTKITELTSLNEQRLTGVPLTRLLFGSGSGFPSRYFGHALINTFNHWKSSGISSDSIWKVIFLNNREFFKSNGIYVLYDTNPLENADVLMHPLLIMENGNTLFPPRLKYEIHSIDLSPLPIGKSDIIVDFKSDSTLWGTCWRCGNLGFGLSAQWQSNCIYGNFVNNYENMWSMGQVINLEGKFGQGWDLSPYNSITVVFDGNLSVPVNVSVLNKYSYIPLSSGANAGDTSVNVNLKSPYSMGVQGIKIAPSGIAQGSYKICLKAVKVNRDSTFLKKLTTNLYRRVQLGTTLSDTTILFLVRKDIKLSQMLYSSPELKYLLAYADYRLIPIVSSKELQKNLLNEAFKSLEGLSSVEARILEYSLRGFEAGLSPFKAIFGSSKRNKLRKIILTRASRNPRTYYVLGISRLFTPPMYGGSIEKAIENFRKSIELFESGNGGEPPYNWGYTDALIFLSIAYKKHGESEKAKKVLDKVFRVSPFNVYGYMQRLFE